MPSRRQLIGTLVAAASIGLLGLVGVVPPAAASPAAEQAGTLFGRGLAVLAAHRSGSARTDAHAAASSVESTADPLGDVVGIDGSQTVEPRADVSEMMVGYGPDLGVSVTVPAGEDPSSSPRWRGNLSGIVAAIDVNGDDVPDFASALFADESGATHVVVITAPPVPSADAGLGLSACGGSGWFDPPTRKYSLFIPSTCLGNAYEARVATVLLFNRATSIGDELDLVFDLAPDVAYTAAVHRAGARDGTGYRFVAGDGGVFSFGARMFFGSAGALPLNRPVVGMASMQKDEGYWLVASDGGIFAYGQAMFYGSTGALPLVAPIVGMATTPTDGGYWLVASDGGIFAFGDARFYGSTGSWPPDRAPVVGMAATPTGDGYWLLRSDGTVHPFGTAFRAPGYGRADSVGIQSTPSGRGFWVVDAAGGVTAMGDAPDLGGLTGGLAAPIVGMTAAPTGRGYWLLGRDGGVFSFGDAVFHGSTGDRRLNQPVVGLQT
jgi:hypothetical protein